MYLYLQRIAMWYLQSIIQSWWFAGNWRILAFWGMAKWHLQRLICKLLKFLNMIMTWIRVPSWDGKKLSPTLPRTNSSPLKIGRNPKGNDRLPTIHFQVGAVSFKEGIFHIWNLKSSNNSWRSKKYCALKSRSLSVSQSWDFQSFRRFCSRHRIIFFIAKYCEVFVLFLLKVSFWDTECMVYLPTFCVA